MTKMHQMSGRARLYACILQFSAQGASQLSPSGRTSQQYLAFIGFEPGYIIKNLAK